MNSNLNKKYNIGITSIGSGVGQSIINSCRYSKLPLKTIGLGSNPFAYGAYDCDEYDYLPSIYERDYIDELLKKCIEYRIDLLIPGLDDELIQISKNKKRFIENGITPLVSDVSLIEICRDKRRMSNELNSIVHAFVQSFSKNELLQNAKLNNIKFPLIAKPKGGFASRGIKLISEFNEILDVPQNYIIQEVAIPSKDDPNFEQYIEQLNRKQNFQVSEISIQLVADEESNIIGRMASFNKLNQGVPIEIIPYKNDQIWEVIDKLLPKFKELGLRGPLNIQGRITEDGFKIFEMNPRFTGITGLRALMGFNEVEASIKKWLNIDSDNISLELNYERFGIRQTSDKAIPLRKK